jgi:hypothetical protein
VERLPRRLLVEPLGEGRRLSRQDVHRVTSLLSVSPSSPVAMRFSSVDLLSARQTNR